jgi:hypothetical protein
MLHVPIAQPVEQLPFKQTVAGSIPAGDTNDKKISLAGDFPFVSAAVMFRFCFLPDKNEITRRGREHFGF